MGSNEVFQVGPDVFPEAFQVIGFDFTEVFNAHFDVPGESVAVSDKCKALQLCSGSMENKRRAAVIPGSKNLGGGQCCFFPGLDVVARLRYGGYGKFRCETG